MAQFKVLKEAYVRYSMTTWQGVVEIEGEEITYRYSEDDNGASLYTYNEANGWEESDLSNQSHAMIYAACMEWGTPEDFGTTGEIVELDDELLEDYI